MNYWYCYLIEELDVFYTHNNQLFAICLCTSSIRSLFSCLLKFCVEGVWLYSHSEILHVLWDSGRTAAACFSAG